MTPETEPKPPRATPHALYAAILLVATIVGFGGVYVMARLADNPSRDGVGTTAAQLRVAQAQSPPQTPSGPLATPPTTTLPTGPGANPLSTGEMAAFVFKKTPEPLPEVGFVDGTGKERTLKDWRGKVVLLNLWATWCVPCRKEMPGLDRLQAQLGSDRFEVVAVSADKTGIEGAKKFLAQVKSEKLGVYADPGVRITSTLKAIGMPATILIDREGREIGRLVGPAEWDSPEAKALIAAAMK
ncbi:MAG: TlpA family protein disulfide reductase [Hyphomicrobiaceae bacterium]